MEIVKRTPYWALVKDEDGIEYEVFFEGRNTMLTWCSKQIAFTDCGSYWVIKVMENNVEWGYAGWQPDMVFEWHRKDGETWIRQFEGWEH